jgi:hypothetical protein
MNFKQIAAAVAILAAAGAANAAVSNFDGITAAGNGSLILVKLDSTGSNVGGLTVDLGFAYNDLANSGALTAANTTVVWDFANNTITKNGSLITGITNDWASQFALFSGDAAETKWAILSGSQKGTTATGFLASGLPSAANLTQQNPTVTGGMAGVATSLLGGTTVATSIGATKGTFASADNGAYAMASTDAGYVGTAYSLTTINGWKNNIKWSTWNADGASTNLTQLNANGTESGIALASSYVLGTNDVLDTTGLLNAQGTFKLVGNTLTWSTAKITTIEVTPSVPEPESYALALVGLAALGFAARRAAK